MRRTISASCLKTRGTPEAPVGTVNSVRLSPEGLTFAADKPAALTLSYANCPLLGQLLPKRIAYTTDLLAILSYVVSLDDLIAVGAAGPADLAAQPDHPDMHPDPEGRRDRGLYDRVGARRVRALVEEAQAAGHPEHVGVDGKRRPSQGEGQDARGGLGPHAGERDEVVTDPGR